MRKRKKPRGITTLKSLPHRENGSPAGASTGGPRTALCQGPGPLESRCRPRPSDSHLAGTRTGAPTASLSLLGGRGTAAGQRPRRLGLTLATRLWRRRSSGARGGLTGRGCRMGVSTGAVKSTWPLLRRSRPRGVNVAPRWTLEDPIEARLHPLGVVAIVAAIPTVILTRGFFFRLPPLPGFSSTRI